MDLILHAKQLRFYSADFLAFKSSQYKIVKYEEEKKHDNPSYDYFQ